MIDYYLVACMFTFDRANYNAMWKKKKKKCEDTQVIIYLCVSYVINMTQFQ